MALGATVYHFLITLSDVDRGVYEQLDLRVARHPSETARYLLTRTLAYCLSYQPGIAFSKGGLSATNEPALSVRDQTGLLTAWIEIGSPSAERLHRATKAARQVELFTHVELGALKREAASRAVHRLESIVVQRLEVEFLNALEALLERKMSFELVRNGGQLYVTMDNQTLSGSLTTASLAADSAS